MSLARGVVPIRRQWPEAANEILRDGLLGGLDAEILAERFGTPLYVYDLGVVDRQVAGLRDALPPGFDLAFAMKANPALAVVAYMAGLGLGADVASGGELETALRAGVGPGRIVMTGPGKRDDELLYAFRKLRPRNALSCDESLVIAWFFR